MKVAVGTLLNDLVRAIVTLTTKLQLTMLMELFAILMAFKQIVNRNDGLSACGRQSEVHESTQSTSIYPYISYPCFMNSNE